MVCLSQKPFAHISVCMQLIVFGRCLALRLIEYQHFEVAEKKRSRLLKNPRLGRAVDLARDS